MLCTRLALAADGGSIAVRFPPLAGEERWHRYPLKAGN